MLIDKKLIINENFGFKVIKNGSLISYSTRQTETKRARRTLAIVNETSLAETPAVKAFNLCSLGNRFN